MTDKKKENDAERTSKVQVSDKPHLDPPLRDDPTALRAKRADEASPMPLSEKTLREQEAGRAASERAAEVARAAEENRLAEAERLRNVNVTATEATAGPPKTEMEAINKDFVIKAEAETDAVHQARAAAGRADAPKTAHDVREAEIQRAADKAVAERAIAEKDISVEKPQIETPDADKTVAERIATEKLKEAEAVRHDRTAAEKAAADHAATERAASKK